MNYIIYFDVAALFIFAIVIWFHYQRKNLPLLQNKAFIVFLFCALINTIFDIISAELLDYYSHFPVWLIWVSNLFAYASTNTLPLIYAVYCLSMINYSEGLSKTRRHFFILKLIVPYVVCILLILLSPLVKVFFDTTLVFYIDSEGIYHRGGFWFYFLYIGLLYYTFMSMYAVLRYRDRLARPKRLYVLSYIGITFIALALQMIFPRYLLQSFGLSLAAIMLSSIIQTPEEYIDRSTDLFNEEALLKMTARDFNLNVPFLCISVILDDITFISNTFGVNQMTRFLSDVADFLKKTFPSAYYYYIPQGKFCLVFRNYSSRDIDKIKFELRARFHENWVQETLELKLYSRICIIECPRDIKNAEDIVDLIEMVAEDARYKQTTIYARDIDTEYKKRTTYISHLLRNALAEKRFAVYYQPIYSTKEERLIGAEALIRMKDDDNNFVSPEEFIPIAEKTGDILRIGQFVFDSVCTTLSSIDLNEYGIKKIDINLSVAQCMQEILADNILTIRTIHNVPASVINLEITETAAAHTPKILLQNMRRLAEEGIELSLDDYGSGYSNMGYLLTLPFKMVKIDKNIVWSAFNNAKSNIALASTIAMINKLGMTVLAEGVETEEQVKWLTSLGCEYLQGFYFGKALPKDDYLQLMKTDIERYKTVRENKNEYLRELEIVEDIDDDLEVLM